MRAFVLAMAMAISLQGLAWPAFSQVDAQAGAQPVRITDDRGTVVTLPRAPQRIVSLLPSLTETVCALGACARLVGVDNYSNWPASVGTLPHVGGLEDANVERIVALRPDVVLLATSARIGVRLESLGVKVAALEPKNQADMKGVFTKIATLLARPDADRIGPQLMQKMDTDIDAAARSVPAAVRGSSVYFEVNTGPYAAGEASFIGQTLARLGVRNIVPAALGPFPQLNPEFVVRANPQFILVSDRDGAALAGRPGWSRIRAVASGQVCLFDAAQGDVLVRPGPRMAEGARLMAACLDGTLARAPGAAVRKP